MLKPLYKTSVVIWTTYDPTGVELEDLGRDATSGESYCSKLSSVLVPKPSDDPDGDDGMEEFFDSQEEEEGD